MEQKLRPATSHNENKKKTKKKQRGTTVGEKGTRSSDHEININNVN